MDKKKKKNWHNEKTILNDGFFERILGIFKGKKKILAIANYNCSSFIWNIDCIKSRFCSGSIYLYNFLVTSILGISAFYHDSAAAIILPSIIKVAALS